MSHENMEEHGLEKNPDLRLAKYKFMLTLPEYAGDEEIIAKIMEEVTKYNMAPWYALFCQVIGWDGEEDLFLALRINNQRELQKLNSAIDYAEQNLGEAEVREACLKRAEYYSRIGDRYHTIDSFRITYDRSISLGHKIDIIFHLIRFGFFYHIEELVSRSILEAHTLIEKGGDWDRRNRLKVYEGLYCVTVRNFKKACSLFLDSVSTFTSYELLDYKDFICYTVFTSLISLPRHQLREKVVNNAEVLEVLESEPVAKDLLNSLYNCSYAEFFKSLAKVEVVLLEDYFFHSHYTYYVREMRIVAYSQFLESFRSLTLKYMAESFGVTVDYIDKDLSDFITAGRLTCKIDKVGGIVETNRCDFKNAQYNSVIKHGDVLINRVQKLSRVVKI